MQKSLIASYFLSFSGFGTQISQYLNIEIGLIFTGYYFLSYHKVSVLNSLPTAPEYNHITKVDNQTSQIV